MRQQLADGVSGNLLGIWLLVPEHLRLGTWELLCGWTQQGSDRVAPRLALQLIHEAALCVSGIRQQRCLSHRGFELANGLAFVATDQAIHDLLAARSVEQGEALQVALGRIRRSLGHYPGRLLALDPHRMISHTQRGTRVRRPSPGSAPTKTLQTFFCLDADSHEPLCCTLGTSGPNVAQATPHVLELAAAILPEGPPRPLVVADCEHFTVGLVEQVRRQGRFDLLVLMPRQPYLQKRLRGIPPEQFVRRWAGLATAKVPYHFKTHPDLPLYLFAQRSGERPQDYDFKGFLSTTDGDEAAAMTVDFPKRWHVEEFFNTHQSLGWRRAGTHNLNIRYGRMTMAMLAQAAISQLRRRLPPKLAQWDAKHLAREIFSGLDGGIKVHQDTIVVTYHNAKALQPIAHELEGLPARLEAEGVDPRVPWLYGLKLDFRLR